jgi:hypothetical protein
MALVGRHTMDRTRGLNSTRRSSPIRCFDRRMRTFRGPRPGQDGSDAARQSRSS